MTILLWVRTKRRLSTYETTEIEHFEDSVRAQGGVGVPLPFEGGDHLLWPLAFAGSPYSLKSQLAPLMQDALVDEWCLTEVGAGCGPEVEQEEIRWSPAEVHLTWDDRFIDPSELLHDDNEGFRRRHLPYVEGISHLDWVLDYNVHGKTGLWVDFERDLDESRHLVSRIERALPGRTSRMWHGRSSLLFAYTAAQDVREAGAYGLNDAVMDVLDEDQVAYWLAFQIGNVSVGGIAENMSQMSDFIWRSRPRGGMDAGSRSTSLRKPSGPPVVVTRVSRRVAHAANGSTTNPPRRSSRPRP